MAKKRIKIDPDDPVAQELLKVFFTSQDPVWRGLRKRLFKAESDRRKLVADLYKRFK